MRHTDVKTTEKYRKRVYQPGSAATAGAILSPGGFRLDEAASAETQSVKPI